MSEYLGIGGAPVTPQVYTRDPVESPSARNQPASPPTDTPQGIMPGGCYTDTVSPPTSLPSLELGEQVNFTELRALQQLKQDFQAGIQSLAQNSPEQFTAILKQVYGDKLDEQQFSELLAQAQNGQFPFPDNIKFVDSAVLQGNHAAYSSEGGGTIYLNRDLLSDPQTLRAAFTEEMGHHLDHRLGGTDTAGDEGQMFQQALARGGPLSEEELAAARADQDQGTITVDGQTQEVEFKGKLSDTAQEAVNTFVSEMSEWGVDAGDLQPAFDALQGLEWPDFNQAVAHLFRNNPDQVAEFFEEAVKEGKMDLAQKFLEWMGDSKLSGGAKNAFIHGMKGANFGYVIQALNQMDESERNKITKGIAKNFGQDCWNAKMAVEGLRAHLSNDTKGLQLIGEAMQWADTLSNLVKNPVAQVVLGLAGTYGDAIVAASKGTIGALVNKLDMETHPNTTVGGIGDLAVIEDLQKLFKDTLNKHPYNRDGDGGLSRLITQFRQGLNKYYGQ